MIDWLRRRQDEGEPSVTVGGRDLPLAIRHHPRATRLTMRLAPDGSEVRITLPRWGRTLDALVFVRSRTEWLESQLAAVPRAAPPAPGATLAYRGERLAIEWDPRLPRRPALAEGVLSLGGPLDTVPARLRRWLEAEALRPVRIELPAAVLLAGARVAHGIGRCHGGSGNQRDCRDKDRARSGHAPDVTRTRLIRR